MLNNVNFLNSDIIFILNIANLKNKAFYIGWNGYDNLGDEVILSATKILFDEKIMFYEKGYLGKGTKFLHDKFNYKFDYLFLGGGTQINRNYDTLSILNTVNAKKKVAFATGVADPEFWKAIPDSPKYLKEWVNELNTFDFIGVRGPLSKRILEQNGVTNDVKIIGDVALVYLKENIPKKRMNKVLGVNLGDTSNLLWGRSDETFISIVTQEIVKLANAGWRIKFFPVYYKDLAIMNDIAKKVDKQNIGIVDYSKGVGNYMSELENVDVFIGEKLHSTILSMCSITPSIMLEYRPKCRDFMESIEMMDFNIRTDQIKVNQLFDLVEHTYSNLETIQKKIFNNCMALKNELVINANVLKIG